MQGRGGRSAAEKLEKIHREMADIAESLRCTQAQQQSVVGGLVVYASVAYFASAVYAYVNCYRQPEWSGLVQRAKLLLGFIVAPFL